MPTILSSEPNDMMSARAGDTLLPCWVPTRLSEPKENIVIQERTIEDHHHLLEVISGLPAAR